MGLKNYKSSNKIVIGVGNAQSWFWFVAVVVSVGVVQLFLDNRIILNSCALNWGQGGLTELRC